MLSKAALEIDSDDWLGSMVLADIDGDGRPELVTVSQSNLLQLYDLHS